MKKWTFTAILISLICFGLAGCNKNPNLNISSGKRNIICTTFPQYDWMKQLLSGVEDQYNLILLLKNGTDMHSYQATAEDIIQISSCDILIYIGGESDNWLKDLLKNQKNSSQITLNLMELLGEKLHEEEIIEGMENEHEDNHDEEIEYDEHIWLSVKNAITIIPELKDCLIQVDSANASIFTKNAENYLTTLKELDNAYEAMITSSKYDTLLFGDRFPFRYLVEDYHLNYYAAFAGCSAESEASFETITFLANKLDELKLPAILTIENSNNKLATSIVNSTTSKAQKILSLNSLQSITNTDLQSGISYLSVMKETYEILKEALN